MMIVERSTRFEAPAHIVWAAVKTPAAFRVVTRGLLTMPAIRTRTEDWRGGETVVGSVFLFGVIPFARHHLHISAIDEATGTLSSREHGGLVRTWNHDIVVTPVDSTTCAYRDRTEIDAGILTWSVGLYARWFYAMRQRRWRALAKELRECHG